MLLETISLEKSFGTKPVLKGVGFKAEGGRALGLLGRNGAGKTTTIRIIMDIFPPDGGQVLWNGRPLRHSNVKMGYLPEERGLYPKRPIGTQLIYLGELRGLSRSLAQTRVNDMLGRFEMSECKNKKLDTLSKGNQQKIQLIAALITKPDLVILDEPFSGLDPVNAQLLKEVVSEQVNEGKVVLFSSHQMNYVEEFCDSIALLHNGGIVLEGDIRQIKRSYPRNRVLAVLTSKDEQTLQKLASTLPNAVLKVEHAMSPLPKEGFVITLKDPGAREQLFLSLASMGADVERFEVLEPTLEEIFVEKVGDSI